MPRSIPTAWSGRSAGVTGAAELPEADHGVHGILAALQENLAVLPDYAFPGRQVAEAQAGRFGTSIAGLVGSLITLTFCVLIGIILKKRGRKG